MHTLIVFEIDHQRTQEINKKESLSPFATVENSLKIDYGPLIMPSKVVIKIVCFFLAMQNWPDS